MTAAAGAAIPAERAPGEAGARDGGIGAGPRCSGQVLVIYDAPGTAPGRRARFVRDFRAGRPAAEAALAAYAAAARDGSFPASGHRF